MGDSENHRTSANSAMAIQPPRDKEMKLDTCQHCGVPIALDPDNEWGHEPYLLASCETARLEREGDLTAAMKHAYRSYLMGHGGPYAEPVAA